MTDGHSDLDAAGRSARQKAERLRERRLENTTHRSRTVRFLNAVMGPSASDKRLLAEERNWATGAEGEQLLARRLAQLCPGVVILHDRRMPRSRANIDHLALAPSGIYVIDTKRYRGKVEIVRKRGKQHLLIAGRDRTQLIDGLDKQVAAVRASIAGTAPDVPIHGCLCFIAPAGLATDSGLPVLRTLKVRGYPLYYPRRLAKRLKQAGPLDTARIRTIETEMISHFPPAVRG
jgi:hypothetical protein